MLWSGKKNSKENLNLTFSVLAWVIYLLGEAVAFIQKHFAVVVLRLLIFY